MNTIRIRAGAYALFAMGLINYVYQGDKSGQHLKSLLLVAFGALTLLSLSAFKNWSSSSKNATVIWWIIAGGLAVFAFL